MENKIREIWSHLQNEVKQNHTKSYSRLELDDEDGFRLSCDTEKNLEILIAVDNRKKLKDFNFPDWNGMNFDLVELNLPVVGITKNVRLKLEGENYTDIFLTICSDLAESLDLRPHNERYSVFNEFLERWTSFFERAGTEGLKSNSQRGLFGELFWLEKLIDTGIAPYSALNSWKGCQRAYHDFEINGRVVEVKTTMTKSPVKVTINNERQLDERGLESLHLLVISLIKSESGGLSLPELISGIIEKLKEQPGCGILFTKLLKSAGYIEKHSNLYKDTYTVRNYELYSVRDDIPRIIDLAEGLGNLKYSLLVGSIQNFIEDKNKYLEMIKKASE